jgi:predicted ATP-dependent endonuclease of OLD family
MPQNVAADSTRPMAEDGLDSVQAVPKPSPIQRYDRAQSTQGVVVVHLESFCIRNYRRLKDIRIELEPETTVFVGSNNSGKTSAVQVLGAFLSPSKADRFSIHDFSAECWKKFDEIGANPASTEALPTIILDLWFKVDRSDVVRAIKLLPDLDWENSPVGVRLEYAPRNQEELLVAFREIHGKAAKHAGTKEPDKAYYHPWPHSLHAYLSKKLRDDYKIFYYVLDHKQFDKNYKQNDGYTPQVLGDAAESGASILKTLLRIDFVNAQRYLSDETSGQTENLSKRLSRFYERNLAKYGDDFSAVAALAKSEEELNTHLKIVFGSTLQSLNELGYPGFADPNLVIKSAFDPESVLTRSAAVHYALRDPGTTTPADTGLTLPDKYNGLGFKNLIYMIIEVLDYHQQWVDEKEKRPPVHLMLIEEPEAHLHAQLQQVFIRKIRKILPAENPAFSTQMVVTTHSSHIIYESNFKPVRYFRRMTEGHYSTVLNLSLFYESEKETRDFLHRYMRLTHCDLFFSDAAVLVEGSVERLLLPLMIEKEAKELQSKYLCILELGGAFAHQFKALIHFLGLNTLIITDIDSVSGAAQKQQDGDVVDNAGDSPSGDEDAEEEGDGGKNGGHACMTIEAGAETSNQTLIQWLPKLTKISDLLAAGVDMKCPIPTEQEPALVRVAYQAETMAKWKEERLRIAGRTFEEAFAYENLEWCQEEKQRQLGLNVARKTPLPLIEMATKIHARIRSKNFKKTDFALALMMASNDWIVPSYIGEGLKWLNGKVAEVVAEPDALSDVKDAQ